MINNINASSSILKYLFKKDFKNLSYEVHRNCNFTGNFSERYYYNDKPLLKLHMILTFSDNIRDSIEGFTSKEHDTYIKYVLERGLLNSKYLQILSTETFSKDILVSADEYNSLVFAFIRKGDLDRANTIARKLNINHDGTTCGKLNFLNLYILAKNNYMFFSEIQAGELGVSKNILVPDYRQFYAWIRKNYRKVDYKFLYRTLSVCDTNGVVTSNMYRYRFSLLSNIGEMYGTSLGADITKGFLDIPENHGILIFFSRLCYEADQNINFFNSITTASNSMRGYIKKSDGIFNWAALSTIINNSYYNNSCVTRYLSKTIFRNLTRSKGKRSGVPYIDFLNITAGRFRKYHKADQYFSSSYPSGYGYTDTTLVIINRNIYDLAKKASTACNVVEREFYNHMNFKSGKVTLFIK